VAIGRFLGGVAAVVWSPANDKYLLLKRALDKDFGPGVWEPVTGRVDQGEGFEDALQREVREEIGAGVTVDLVLGTIHFHRGEPSPQTELIGVVYLCSLQDPQVVRIGPEHAEHRWANLTEAEALLTAPDASTQWCRRVIARADAMRRLLPPALRERCRQTGFELG
jgi:8-oxo-dGTP diphosphatase